MRFICGLLMTAILASMAIQAHAGTGLVVGTFNCRQQLPCDVTDPSFPKDDKLIADTSACVSRYMSVKQGTEMFDDAAGLDSNMCFTTVPAAFPLEGQSTAIPQCCIKRLQTGTCAVHCDILSE